MTIINSVLGPLDTADMGFTLSHEHILETAAGIPQVYPEFVDREAVIRDGIAIFKRVYAEGGTFISHQYAPQIDGAVATIRFRNGSVASLGAGMVGIGGLRSEDYYVSTEKGVAEASGPFDNLDTLRYALRDDPNNVVEESFPDSDPFKEEIRHFLACVRSGETPAVTGEDGRKAIELCLAIKEAARTGRPVEM